MKRIGLGCVLAFLAAGAVHAQNDRALDAKIQGAMHRLEFENLRWGMEFRKPDTGQVIYAVNQDQLFQPASSIKVFIEGTAFSTLGPDYRFHTPIYRTGPIKNGVLMGDLVLVASGDLMISGRIRPDGTLALPEPDHSYDVLPGAGPAPGDPLQVIRELARQIAAHGIKRIEGRVLVDDSLFRQGTTNMGGTPVILSPMMINDNYIDVTVTPGNTVGSPAILHISPQTAYVRIVNEVKTAAADAASPRRLAFSDDVAKPDGTHVVKLTGEVPLGGHDFRAYNIPEPGRFGEIALVQALKDAGVTAKADLSAKTDFKALASHYTKDNQVAEHVSPPLSTEVEGMTKLSSNIHTGTFPYLIGAIAGHDHENALAAGEELMRQTFRKAGLDPYGPGVSGDKYSPEFFIKFSPEFFARFLSYMTQQPYFPLYRQALPVMGRDGTLTDIQRNSPAAGHVHAKTGTGVSGSPGGKIHIVKALAGYIELPNGQQISFGEFMDFDVAASGVEALSLALAAADKAGEALGEVATAVYESSPL